MKRDAKIFKMPKNMDPWQKDLQALIGKTVKMEHRLGKQINIYKNAEILNVDIKMGNRFKIKQKNGKVRFLIGGTYDILEIENQEENIVPECLGKDYSNKVKAK